MIPLRVGCSCPSLSLPLVAGRWSSISPTGISKLLPLLAPVTRDNNTLPALPSMQFSPLITLRLNLIGQPL